MQTALQTKPDHLSWEQYIADSAQDDPPIENRLAVPVSEAAAYSFIDFFDEHSYCRPEHIGWDIRRLHGGSDAMGWDMFATLVAMRGAPDECHRAYSPDRDGVMLGKGPSGEYDTPVIDFLIYDPDAYLDRMWVSFDRERTDSDCLIIDGMDEALHYGWKAPPEIMAAIEKLRDMRSARAARRKADAEAAEALHYAAVEAQQAADFALYEQWLADGEPADVPLAAKHRERKRRILRFQIEADYDAIQNRRQEAYQPFSEVDPTPEQDAAITTEYDARMAAWRVRHAHQLPHLYTDDMLLPPGLSVPDMDRLLAEFAERRAAARPQSMPPGMPAPMPMPPKLTVVPAAPLPDLIKTSAEFVEGFIPPEYLLDGVLQRRFCYSMTAQTGVGKTTVAMRLSAHVACGRSLGGLDVEKGSVLYFAGENPTDIQMRWLGLTQAMVLDPATTDVHFVPGSTPLSQVAERITAEVVRKGLRPALVVVDTAAAYFEGDDENSNTQAVDHAKRMRSLTELPGGPSVLILTHPTKRAADDDLIPRGGGAFLAEVDGNIALRKLDSLITASALGKFRGPEFPPLSFEIETVREHPKLRDTRGRYIPTVIAKPIDAADHTRIERNGRSDEDALLKALDGKPSASPTDLARSLGWMLRPVGGKEPAVNHVKAKRLLERLRKEKLVDEVRGNWKLTSKGQQHLNDADRSQSMDNRTVPFPLPMMPRRPFEQS